MKDLQTLLTHPNVHNFDRLLLASGAPITLVRDNERKAIGGALSSQQLHGLLKASLPAEVFAEFAWGKELRSQIAAPGGTCELTVNLRPDKIIQVEILPPKASQPQTAALPAGDEGTASEDEVARISDVAEATLVYASQGVPAELLERLAGLGYPTRGSAQAAAVIEVLKYNDYPVFAMVLGRGYREDPVYRFLIEQNMDLRRKQFSVLVAPGLVTGDTLLAFSLSVNLVVDERELGRLTDVIAEMLPAWKRFVAPLHEFLEKAGRL